MPKAMPLEEMITVEVSPQEMEDKYVARFSEMKPQTDEYNEESGLPKDFYDEVLVRNLYLMMAPADQGGPMAANAAIKGRQGLSVMMVDLVPGDSPLLHGHFKTAESFMCLDGQIEITWGDEGENKTMLNKYDLIAVPSAVCRSFENVGTENAKLLVLIHGEKNEDFNDIGVAPAASRWIRDRWGMELIEKGRNMGTQYLGLDG